MQTLTASPAFPQLQGLGVQEPTSWWSGLPMSSKIAYSVIAVTSTGAVVGGLKTERPITGVFIGSAVGFMLWGMGAAVYTGYRTTRAIEAAAKRLTSTPIL